MAKSKHTRLRKRSMDNSVLVLYGADSRMLKLE